ncbi:MAG: hypothetical protein JNM81_07400 [Rhodospirillaceae bacterium]|nr:hypothetical protein [Rhodospirillaceae bacterium]
MAQTHSGQSGDENWHFGWSEIVAAALAVGLAVLASPSPAASAPLKAQVDDEDWNFLWVKPADNAPFVAATSDEGAAIQVSGTFNPALQSLADVPPLPRSSVMFDAPSTGQSSFNRRIEFMPVGARSAPPVDGVATSQPGITLREDRWTVIDTEALRLSAYARGTLDREDASLARSPMPFPRGVGTGLGVITATPIYVGATVKTDRSIYDIDSNRFDGARWSTSVFMGTETSFGPLYLGTSKDADGARSAYLYLGRWF